MGNCARDAACAHQSIRQPATAGSSKRKPPAAPPHPHPHPPGVRHTGYHDTTAVAGGGGIQGCVRARCHRCVCGRVPCWCVLRSCQPYSGMQAPPRQAAGGSHGGTSQRCTLGVPNPRCLGTVSPDAAGGDRGDHASWDTRAGISPPMAGVGPTETLRTHNTAWQGATGTPPSLGACSIRYGCAGHRPAHGERWRYTVQQGRRHPLHCTPGSRMPSGQPIAASICTHWITAAVGHCSQLLTRAAAAGAAGRGARPVPPPQVALQARGHGPARLLIRPVQPPRGGSGSRAGPTHAPETQRQERAGEGPSSVEAGWAWRRPPPRRVLGQRPSAT